jgi:hypothetical protein
MGSNRTPPFAVMASLALASSRARTDDLPSLKSANWAVYDGSLECFLKGLFP